MDKPITPETEKHIRTLCDDIATAESLTDDLHNELYTHIEDKILGYLSGEETLSEADAYLLAKEHFGDRAKVREELEDLHPAGENFNLYRRLAIPVTLTMALGICFGLPYQFFTIALRELPFSPSAQAWGNFALMNMVTLLALYILFKTLHTWKQKEMKGEVLWFQSWSTGKLFFLIGVMFIITECLKVTPRIVFYSNFQLTENTNTLSFFPYDFMGDFKMIILLLISGSLVVPWLLWCDIRPKPKKTLFHVVLAFVLYNGLSIMIGSLIVFTPKHLAPLADQPDLVLLELNHYEMLLSTHNFADSFYHSILYPLIPALVMWLAYTLFKRRRNKHKTINGLAIAK